MDLFVTGTDGRVYRNWWNSADGGSADDWAWWAATPNDQDFTNAATSVGAVARTPDSLDLFVAGKDGKVYRTWWNSAGDWAWWVPTDEGFTKAATSVAAVSRKPDTLDLFVTGKDGRVYSTWWNSADDWAWWFPFPMASVSAVTPVTAVARTPDCLDLFVTGTDGRIYWISWSSTDGWAPWWFQVDPSFTKAVTSVAAVSRKPDTLDLFVPGKDGKVYRNWWNSKDNKWAWWVPTDEGFTKAASSVAAVARTPDSLDLFVAGKDGRVYSTWWNSTDDWAWWFRIDHAFTNSAPVTALTRSPDRLDVFVAPSKDPQRHGGGEAFWTYWDPSPATLRGVTITFDTHHDNKDSDTIVHVFVKNRLNNSLTPQQDTDFVSNWLAFQRCQSTHDIDGDRNPYLAYAYFLGQDDTWDNPSSHTLQLELVADDISVNGVVLPQVDIHMLANGDDRWIFDYTVTLTFDNGEFSFTSASNVPGIILDQDNRNHSGFGIENPLRTLPLPVLTKADTNAILTKVTLEFSTHNDGKDWDTRLNVHIVNRISDTLAQDIAIGLDLFHDEEFPDSGQREDLYRKFSWPDDGPLVSDTIRLADMVLPVVYIVIIPNGNDRWIFDYRVSFEFEDPQDFEHKPRIYSSQIYGVILDQDNNKHMGVYQGRPFPTVTPPTAPKLTFEPIDRTGNNRKEISIPFLQRKFDEFINNRNGSDTDPNPPLRKIHLGSSPVKWSLPVTTLPIPLPESYVDVQSINAGGDGNVYYVSGSRSLGQLKKWRGFLDSYLEKIDSESVQLNIDAQQAVTPLTLTVGFRSGGTLLNQQFGRITLDSFSILLRLTLDKAMNGGHTVVDLMSWVAEITDLQKRRVLLDPQRGIYRYIGTFLHQPVNFVGGPSIGDLFVEQVVKVSLITSHPSDPGGILRKQIRDQIYSTLTSTDVITGTTPRDDFNSMATSWLLGGVADDDDNTDENNAVIQDIRIKNEDTLVIKYTGPRNVFVPQRPTNWPTGHDFSPGSLANIDHIVVLTMENRSFDHMLGYLSLPVSKNGMGRQDVDGLKGGEFNPYNGQNFPSFEFELNDTIFSPAPPHGYEPVHHAINSGQMDGFVRSYAEAHGDAVAYKIMGYHTRRNVPRYDALARDFAIGHRWFASHPGPTFCNRFSELTGRLNLDPRGFWEFDNSSPLRPVFTPTIFDYLSDAINPRVTWRYFEHGYCFLRFFERYTFDDTNIVAAGDPDDPNDPESSFFATAKAGRLPNVSFIDPHFIELPPGAFDDDAPADISKGQDFVRKVVEAVIAGPAWNNTLLLIVSDEHGGFYDHVPPPAAIPVSDDLPIKTYGVRVPAFVISPWVGAGSVFGHDGTGHPRSALYFDHTSILKTIARRFLSHNPPYMGARYAAANDLSMVIGTHRRQSQFLPFIRYRLQYAPSQMMLDVKLANRAPGTVLWQFPSNGGIAQDFSFEDAGNGYVYIRSHVSNLYVTVRDVLPRVVIQDVKYPLRQLARAARPELQEWKLSPTGMSINDRNLFVISNKAYPNLVLQPANSGQPESTIVLGAAGTHRENAWKVSSPLFRE